MKQRNFRDVEYLKKSQKDISDKINGALDEVLANQKSSTRPISAPSKGSFIMKAAAQARFPTCFKRSFPIRLMIFVSESKTNISCRLKVKTKNQSHY